MALEHVLVILIGFVTSVTAVLNRAWLFFINDGEGVHQRLVAVFSMKERGMNTHLSNQ